MRVWELQDAAGFDHLRQVDRPEPTPGPGQVVVDMKAASLNYRDVLTIKGARDFPLIPFSDGAGTVSAVGAGVTRLKAGDRVCPMFFQNWIDGGPTAYGRAKALGGTAPGVLQDRVLAEAEAVSKIPDHLSWEEAATLPCAALTAWRAVAVEAPAGPGDTVLVQGTGGVSIFALQFAKARGAKVIVTSSSDEKLERAKALGADLTINYKTTEAWGKAARELTGKRGVDVIVEVGGAGTLAQSIDAATVGGRIVLIGLLTGATQQINVTTLFGKNLHVIGVSVGSREQFEGMAKAIGEWKLKPVVDKVYPFAQVPDALRAMEQGQHFGKIAVAY